MEESQNQVEEKELTSIAGNKKKKKFVYLEKYENYKDYMHHRVKALEKSISIAYVLLGVVIVWVILLTIKS